MPSSHSSREEIILSSSNSNVLDQIQVPERQIAREVIESYVRKVFLFPFVFQLGEKSKP